MSRWLDETGGTHGEAYQRRFAALAAEGVDVHGEASYVDTWLRDAGLTRARVLDAGCGTGRVAAELHRRGHDVVGVDSDASMLTVAQRIEGPRWVHADLRTLDLADRFDVVVAAGNVMVFLAAGTEPEVVARMAGHLAGDGLLISGWRTDRLAVATYDQWVAAAGLRPVVRHSTWSGDPWHPAAPWCTAVDQAPQRPGVLPSAHTTL